MNSKLRKNAKKFIAGILAVSLTGGVVYYNGTLKTEAQANVTLPGIQTVVNRYSGGSDAYCILEIVPDKADASIGFLIGGQEPVYNGKKLSEMPAQSERNSAMSSLSSNGIANILSGQNNAISIASSGYNESDKGSKTLTIKGQFVADELGEYNYNTSDVEYIMLEDSSAQTQVQRYTRTSTFTEYSSGSSDKRVNLTFSSSASGEAIIYKTDATTEKTITTQKYSLKNADEDLTVDTVQGYVDKAVYKEESNGEYSYYGTIVKGNYDADASNNAYKYVSGGDAGENVYYTDTDDVNSQDDEVKQLIGNKLIYLDYSLYIELPDGSHESWRYCYVSADDMGADKYYSSNNTYLGDEKLYFIKEDENDGGMYIKTVKYDSNGLYLMSDEYQKSSSGNYKVNIDSAKNIIWKEESTFNTDAAKRFRFVPGSGDIEITVNYDGGITNNEWFKKNVLNLTEDECSSMNVEVKTLTLSELCELVADSSKSDVYGVSLDDVNMVYLSGHEEYGIWSKAVSDVTNVTDAKLQAAILKLAKMAYGVNGSSVNINSRVPFIIDYSFYSKNSSNGLGQLALYLLQAENTNIATDELAGFTSGNQITGLTDLASKADKIVKEKSGDSAATLSSVQELLVGNVYLCKGNIASSDFNTKKSTALYSDVTDVAEYENFLLQQNNITNKISEDITDATIVRYIINWTSKRETLKTTLNVLDVEPSGSYDSDAELKNKIVKYMNEPDYDKSKINITHMASAEFIGKIEDLNSTYDLIYFGDNLEQFNTTEKNGTKTTLYNDAYMNGLIYTHTGDVYTYRSGVESNDITRLQNDSLSYSSDAYEYRASGNDINSTRCAELEDYIQAGYAVIFADRYFTENTDGTYSVNTETVDSNSYYYQVMKFALDSKYWNKNVYIEGSLNDTANQETFKNYLSLSKVSIEWESVNGSASKPVEYEYTVNSTTKDTNGNVTAINSSVKMMEGDELTYTFSLNNASEVAAAGITYDCKLFIDSNADGRFAGDDVTVEVTDTEELDGLNIYAYENGSWNKVSKVSDHYALTTGKIYRVTRSLPADYAGALPWELVFYNNSNTGVRVSETGYTAIKRSETEEIKILQLMSDKENEWNLTTNKNDSGYDPEVGAMLAEVKNIVGFDVTIDSMNVSEVVEASRTRYDENNKWYYVTQNGWETGYSTNCRNYAKGFFDNYDMIIIGFGDNYMFGEKAVYDESLRLANLAVAEALKDYINSGKSVLFTHDSSTYVESTAGKDNSWYWGYEFNKVLRATLGLDRFGVNKLYYEKMINDTSDTDLKAYYQKSYDILNSYKYDTIKEPNTTTELGRLEGLTRYTTVRYMSTHLRGLISSSGTGKAFSGDNGSFYFPVNNKLFYNALYKENNDGTGTSQALFGTYSYDGTASSLTVSNVNKGQITTYPYTLPDNMTVANTHYQWLQPNMEIDNDGDGKNDIVVWYCLSDLSDDAKTTKISKDGSASNIYSLVKNDVVNNYYIYTMGNVTYSGVGHSKPLRLSASDEKRLFINTMVAAYKRGMKTPSVDFLDTAGNDTSGVSVMFDSQNGIVLNTSGNDNQFSVYFEATDNNILSGKEIRVEFFKVADSDAGALSINGITAKVVPLSGADVTVKRKSNNSTVTAKSVAAGTYSDDVNSRFAGSTYYSVQNGEEYVLSFNAEKLGIFTSQDGKLSISSSGDSSLIYARVTTVYNNGNDITDSSVETLTIYPAELFELR